MIDPRLENINLDSIFIYAGQNATKKVSLQRLLDLDQHQLIHEWFTQLIKTTVGYKDPEKLTDEDVKIMIYLLEKNKVYIDKLNTEK